MEILWFWVLSSVIAAVFAKECFYGKGEFTAKDVSIAVLIALAGPLTFIITIIILMVSDLLNIIRGK